MNCDDIKHQLTEFVYDELPPDDRRAVEAHLASCQPCRDQVKQLQNGHDLVEAAANAARERQLAEIDAAAVVRRAEQRTQLSRRRWRGFALLATAATLLVALMNWMSLRLEIHSTHLVVGWSQPVENQSDQPEDPKLDALRGQLDSHDARLEEFDQMMQLALAEIKNDNEELEPGLLAFCMRLDQRLRQQEQRGEQRWETTKQLIRHWRPEDVVALQPSTPGAAE